MPARMIAQTFKKSHRLWLEAIWTRVVLDLPYTIRIYIHLYVHVIYIYISYSGAILRVQAVYQGVGGVTVRREDEDARLLSDNYTIHPGKCYRGLCSKCIKLFSNTALSQALPQYPANLF